MKKAFLLVSIFLILSLPFFAHGFERSYDVNVNGSTISVDYDGLVPCGRCFEGASDQYSDVLDQHHSCDTGPGHFIPCDACHLFITFDNLANYILIDVVIPVALFILVLAGIFYLTAAQKPKRAKRAKKTIVGAVAGMIIAFASYALVAVFATYFLEWDIGWSGGLETQQICNLELEEDPFD